MLLTQRRILLYIYNFRRNGRYEEILEIWVDSVHHFRIPYLVVGIEDSCEGLEANCVTASWSASVRSDLHLSFRYGYVVNLKWLLLLDFLEHGFDVIYTDLDVLFKQNPLLKRALAPWGRALWHDRQTGCEWTCWIGVHFLRQQVLKSRKLLYFSKHDRVWHDATQPWRWRFCLVRSATEL